MARLGRCAIAATAIAFLSVLALAAARAKQVLTGEFGQEVLGCQCAGKKTVHGYCGYHFHLGSNEDEPWCRTKYGCGNSSLTGSWAHCDPRGVERRRAKDGNFYTASEFREYYKGDGKVQWSNAEKHIERRIAQNDKSYTAFEFRDYYVDALGERGWLTEWVAARPEMRRDKDGAWRTWDDFVTTYGYKMAWSAWESARTLVDEL